MFKDRLLEAMEIRGMKPVELSEKTGIHKGTISHYLSGETVPKTERTYLIAKALDVQEAWLIGYDVDMDRPSTREEKISEIEKMLSQLSPEQRNAIMIMIQGLTEK